MVPPPNLIGWLPATYYSMIKFLETVLNTVQSPKTLSYLIIFSSTLLYPNLLFSTNFFNFHEFVYAVKSLTCFWKPCFCLYFLLNVLKLHVQVYSQNSLLSLHLFCKSLHYGMSLLHYGMSLFLVLWPWP